MRIPSATSFLINLTCFFGALGPATASLTTDIDPAFVTPCLAAIQASGFDFFDFERFEEWFDDESTAELSQAGKFVGTKEIMEYAAFGTVSPFWTFAKPCEFKTDLTKATADGCAIVRAGINRFEPNEDTTVGGASFDSLAGFKMHYSLVGDGPVDGVPGILLTKAQIYYSDDFLQHLYGESFNSPLMADYVCDVIESSCPDIHSRNNLTSDSCRSTFLSLPLIEGAGFVDGNTRGCRSIHSVFAKSNDDHCPHLSFAPETDYLGRIKCQETKNRTPDEVFGPELVAHFRQLGREFGLGESGFRILGDFDEPATCPFDPAAPEPPAADAASPGAGGAASVDSPGEASGAPDDGDADDVTSLGAGGSGSASADSPGEASDALADDNSDNSAPGLDALLPSKVLLLVVGFAAAVAY